jgi:hypothetical protein
MMMPTSAKSLSNPLTADVWAPTSWGLVQGSAELATDDLATLFAAFDQHLATLPIAEKLGEAGRWLAHLADLYVAHADLLLTGWQNKHHPTEPVLTDALDDLFTQSQFLDLADLFEEPDPHFYPAARNSPTTQVAAIDKADLLDWIDAQPEELPEVLEIPEDEDPTAWMAELANFWNGFEAPQVNWADLCSLTRLPPGALLLAVLLGGYPHYRHEGSDFYDNHGVWVQPNPLRQDAEGTGDD